MQMILRLFLIFVFFLPLSASEKKTVCLNMIVKDEKDVIKRSLESTRELIDTWVIVDTGSTDGTQEMIKEYFKDVPGELIERPWQNFEHNRNEALSLAKNKADYILILDADDSLFQEEGFKLGELKADAYYFTIYHGGSSYSRPQLIKASLPWKWVGVLHEGLFCKEAQNFETMENLKYIFGGDGARSKDPKKYAKDAKILEDAVQKDPSNTRYVFYLAQSYKDAGNLEKSLEWYKRRIELGGWQEEVFWSMLQLAHLKKALGMPLQDVLESYQRAHSYRPHRVEPLYHMVELYNTMQNFKLAYAMIQYQKAMNAPKERDVLFNQDWINDYAMDFQLSICSYYVEKYSESLSASDKLLSNPRLPLALREQTIKNRVFAEQKINGAK